MRPHPGRDRWPRTVLSEGEGEYVSITLYVALGSAQAEVFLVRFWTVAQNEMAPSGRNRWRPLWHMERRGGRPRDQRAYGPFSSLVPIGRPRRCRFSVQFRVAPVRRGFRAPWCHGAHGRAQQSTDDEECSAPPHAKRHHPPQHRNGCGLLAGKRRVPNRRDVLHLLGGDGLSQNSANERDGDEGSSQREANDTHGNFRGWYAALDCRINGGGNNWFLKELGHPQPRARAKGRLAK